MFEIVTDQQGGQDVFALSLRDPATGASKIVFGFTPDLESVEKEYALRTAPAVPDQTTATGSSSAGGTVIVSPAEYKEFEAWQAQRSAGDLTSVMD